ncbi:glycerate dehydrogenase [Photobacterium angustum]|uniref:D-2-hydroxyacid dehydrogenase n=1 Tax=Photobacterium angustum TaxID=661 RepID=UPI0005E1388D|nr:D-2-hydroxyacid dehydrogenase [Photobacterium angustum]KJG06817.1 glycerate dehydrogenase [Photobacterium angustum]PSV90002.1 D-2-hydroxyacid dehydrogenase [Photobacterium angustum]PSW78404.1 D-2-hydroxyacid dehydrogenase [Photobacterium angustum]
MEHIVFLDRATIPEHIDIPRPQSAHQWIEYQRTSPSQVIERLQHATIVISNKVQLTADILSQLPNLKFIAIGATGTNNVDLDYCHRHNIPVSNIRGYATRSVPEHVLAMIFALKRNLIGYQQDIIAGEWQKQQQFCFFTHSISDIAGSTIGIIGKGSLGVATANLATALGMKVLFAEHKHVTTCREGYTLFNDVLQQADIITLHCPLTDTTKDLIAKTELAQMKPNAILINTGRGGLVNEQDLVDALLDKKIAGAGCDVFTSEPPTDDNPLLQQAHLPNLLLTPHVAWGSDSAITALVNQLIENIECFCNGKPHNLV